MANIRIIALPAKPTPASSAVVMVDDGSSAGKTTLDQLVQAGRPLANQSEAEAGTNADKTMTPLTTNQAITALGAGLFASTAQGGLADTAVQPADLYTVATSGDYDDLSGKPTLGTMAAEDASDYSPIARAIPSGGAAFQALGKASGTDYDMQYFSVATLIDEDDMASDSATQAPSQQSTKFFVNAKQTTFATKAEAAAFNLATPYFITLLGRDAVGDMRGEVRLRRYGLSAPSHPGYLLMNGYYYEIYGDTVNALFFGQPGLGVTADNTIFRNACVTAAAIGATVVDLVGAVYYGSRTVGTDDRYGFLILESNIKIRGNGATMRRFDTDISTEALAYPILFVGTPDSNDSGDLVENVRISGVTFIGQNVNHGVQGSAINDYRDAIHFKNTYDTFVKRCNFTNIDSAAIVYQAPYWFCQANTRYFNTTKNRKSRVEQCTFEAVPHATLTRAFIHAIILTGVDDFLAQFNDFSWCDDCFSGFTTYAYETQMPGSTWTPAEGSGWPADTPVERCGRGWKILHNRMVDSSEHSIYIVGTDCEIRGNVVEINETAIAVSSQIKIHVAGGVVDGNRLFNVGIAFDLQQHARNLTITNNVSTGMRNTAGSIAGGRHLSISVNGASTWFDARPWYDGDHIPVYNLVFANNSMVLPEDEDTSSTLTDLGYRIRTDSTNANFLDGMVSDVVFSNNTNKNMRRGMLFSDGALVRRIACTGEIWLGKPLDRTTFSGATSMLSKAAFSAQSTAATAFQHLSITGCIIDGWAAAWDIYNASGSSLSPPWGVRANTFRFIQAFGSAEFVVPGSSAQHQFHMNSGSNVIDRTWRGIMNSFGDGSNTSDSRRRTMAIWGGSTTLPFYRDDAGTSTDMLA